MLMQSPRTGFPIVPAPLSAAEPVLQASAFTAGSTIDLDISQLLCARLCHDLIGPAAAINAGGELMLDGQEGAEFGSDVRELIVESGRQLAGRLTFFRMAFGAGGARTPALTCRAVHDLASGFLRGGRIRLDWQLGDAADDEALLPADAARMLLCLVMLAAEALVRGGGIRVAVGGGVGQTDLSVIASGPAPRLSDEVTAALRATEPQAVTARTVHAFYFSRLAERLRACVTIERAGADALVLDAHVPHPA